MGNTDSKLNFRKSVVQLTTRTQPVDANDEAFWSQFWSDSATCIQDVFTLIPAAEIRALREESPSNLATLCYKAVEKLVQVADSGCRSVKEEQMVQNCIRLLIRILPYIFEDPDWRGFFWSTLPGHKKDETNDSDDSVPLAQSLITSLCDLLFCPDFTVSSNKKAGPDNPEDMSSIDSCEYIWTAGVGFTHNPPTTAIYEQNRTEILKLLLTCFSETMYLPTHADSHTEVNQWIAYFTSTDNRHALPLFTSLLNVVCSYDPIGYGLPYNYLMFSDSREPLVEIALHVLCVTLDTDNVLNQSPSEVIAGSTNGAGSGGGERRPSGEVQFGGSDNLFVNYLSRIHREEDFSFMLKGITRLLNNPLLQTYLPGSCKKIQFHQELLVFLWKICDINKKFMFYVLKSSDVLDILVPILFYLNDARSDQSRVGLMHIGVFILLLLSGERNFGVRLNKPYSVRVPMDIPVFTGSHADLLIIVFHKIITTGHQRLQPLFDCLLTIIVNVSPYLKTLSMVASAKLLHLLEAFSTPWFLFASPSNHHLMFFLLEVFNNIIQYQFDGNSNLVYTIIRKRQIFHQLASLPCDHASIAKALTRLTRKLSKTPSSSSSSQLATSPTSASTTTNHSDKSMEGSIPAASAEPGTLQTSLAATPAMHSTTRTFPTILKEDDDDQEFEHYALSKFQGIKNEHIISYEYNQANRLTTHYDKENAWWQNAKRNNIIDSYDDLKVTQKPVEFAHVGPLINISDDDADIGGLTGTKNKIKMVESTRASGDGCEKVPLSKLIGMPRMSVSDSLVKSQLIEMIGIDKMTEKSQASTLTTDQVETNPNIGPPSKFLNMESNMSNLSETLFNSSDPLASNKIETSRDNGNDNKFVSESGGKEDDGIFDDVVVEGGDGEGGRVKQKHGDEDEDEEARKRRISSSSSAVPASPTNSTHSAATTYTSERSRSFKKGGSNSWVASPEWVQSWKQKLPLQTIMRLLQVLVPQVEKICIDKGLTDESEILKFLQHGTLVGLLPVPHPILIRKYQANSGTTMWFRTYMWGIIYLRNVDPPIWYDTDIKLFEIQRV